MPVTLTAALSPDQDSYLGNIYLGTETYLRRLRTGHGSRCRRAAPPDERGGFRDARWPARGRLSSWVAARTGGQAVVVLVDQLGLGPGGVPVPGAGEVPGGAEGPDVGGWVWLQALQDVLGEAG